MGHTDAGLRRARGSHGCWPKEGRPLMSSLRHCSPAAKGMDPRPKLQLLPLLATFSGPLP